MTVERIRSVADVVSRSFRRKELDFFQFLGEPYFVAYAPSPAESAPWRNTDVSAASALHIDRRHVMVSALHPERGPLTSFDRDRMWDVAKSAMPDVPIADAVWLDAYDAYYYSHDGMRPLWDIVVIVLSVGGVAISVTSALPAWRRLVRQGRRVGRASTTLPELVTVHRNEQNREV